MLELFLLALMFLLAGSVLLLGYGILIAATALIAAIQGRPIRHAIQPLLNEWSDHDSPTDPRPVTGQSSPPAGHHSPTAAAGTQKPGPVPLQRPASLRADSVWAVCCPDPGVPQPGQRNQQTVRRHSCDRTRPELAPGRNDQ